MARGHVISALEVNLITLRHLYTSRTVKLGQNYRRFLRPILLVVQYSVTVQPYTWTTMAGRQVHLLSEHQLQKTRHICLIILKYTKLGSGSGANAKILDPITLEKKNLDVLWFLVQNALIRLHIFCMNFYSGSTLLYYLLIWI